MNSPSGLAVSMCQQLRRCAISNLKPKQWHEQHLASADKEKIVLFLDQGDDDEIRRIAVDLARNCDLFVHFERLWRMRVVDLDEKLSAERYMKHIYVNKRALHKEFVNASRV